MLRLRVRPKTVAPASSPAVSPPSRRRVLGRTRSGLLAVVLLAPAAWTAEAPSKTAEGKDAPAAAAQAKEESKKPAAEPAKHASLVAYPGASITVQDEASDISVSVTPDGQSVEAKDPKGNILWKVKLATGKEIGTPVVRHLAITGGGLDAVVGKHNYFTLDLKTGKILKEMAD